MKIVFQAPIRLSELATERFAAEKTPSGAVFFRPLSAPRYCEDRIDVGVKSSYGPRSYPYKRADESVN